MRKKGESTYRRKSDDEEDEGRVITPYQALEVESKGGNKENNYSYE